MNTTDLDRTLHNQSGDTLLGLIDSGTPIGQAIVERAVELYKQDLLPERLFFCVDRFLEGGR